MDSAAEPTAPPAESNEPAPKIVVDTELGVRVEVQHDPEVA